MESQSRFGRTWFEENFGVPRFYNSPHLVLEMKQEWANGARQLCHVVVFCLKVRTERCSFLVVRYNAATGRLTILFKNTSKAPWEFANQKCESRETQESLRVIKSHWHCPTTATTAATLSPDFKKSRCPFNRCFKVVDLFLGKTHLDTFGW